MRNTTWQKIRNVALSQRFWVAGLTVGSIFLREAFGFEEVSDVQAAAGAIVLVLGLVISYAWREPNV